MAQVGFEKFFFSVAYARAMANYLNRKYAGTKIEHYQKDNVIDKKGGFK